MKILNNLNLKIVSTVSFIVFNLISIPAILSESNRDHEFIVYTFWRPPFQLSGTIDSQGNYYYFTNARPIECDLKITEGCFMKSKQSAATVISPGIIKVSHSNGYAYGCAESLITTARANTKHLPQYSWGYGICTQNGWVSRENSYMNYRK